MSEPARREVPPAAGPRRRVPAAPLARAGRRFRSHGRGLPRAARTPSAQCPAL